jgi:hypothetical protein
MSDKTNTLAGLLKLNDANMADIYPTNLLDDAPVISGAFAVSASQGGTLHKYLRRTAAAESAFRKINTGVTNDAETFEEVSLVCEFLDGSFTRDVALASGYRGGLSEYIQKETLASLRGTFANAERALFTNIAGGFPGLLQFSDYVIDNNASQIINKGGANGASRSVWLLRWAEDGVAVVAGNDGRMDMMWDDDSPTIVQVSATGGVYSAYRVTIGGYLGLQVGSKFDAVRICGLDGTEGKKLTDDIIADAISRFAATRGPNMIVMNRTSQKELRESRTSVNPTGAPAPFPMEAFGIPIVTTDLLPSNEATVNSTTTATTSTTTAA